MHHLVPGKVNVPKIWKTVINTNAFMQHEENGCEKVLWPFLETNKGSRLHKNSGIR